MRLSPHTIGLIALGLCKVAAAKPTCAPEEWVNLASIPSPRQEHGVAAIGDDTIAVVGGIDSSQGTTDLVQLYSISSDTWKTVSPAPRKFNHPNVASVGDKLYLLGGLIDQLSGFSINWVANGSSYVYDPATDTWTDLPSVPKGSERGSAIVGVHDEMIYLAGGSTVLRALDQGTIDTVISFNTTSNEWQDVVKAAATLPDGRQHAAGAVIGDSFYVVGGRRDGVTDTRDSVFELDLADQSSGWKTSPGRMPVPRGGLAGAVVGTKFYAFGGEGDPDTDSGAFPQSEAFDAESQTWSEVKAMPVPRHGNQAASVGDRVYIPGGGLQQDFKLVMVNGRPTFHQPSAHFDAYCA